MLIIPTKALRSQTLQVVLANQNCEIDIYQKSTGLYLNLRLLSPVQQIATGALCLDRNRIVREAYLGFIGDLYFYDTTAAFNAAGQFVSADPDWTGLGDQFQLIYQEASDPASPGPL